jgi:phenylalanyl-tRNA synthetase beta chain
VADKACPLFVGRLIRGVKNGPSPDWLQRQLKAIGLRPISALVDVTNFLTFDRARPLHVFDAAKLVGGITVRLSRPGESLLALDGKTYAFDDAMTLICDDAGPEGIGGVMGGEHTGCTEATTDVFIEAAYFDPTRTAATGRKLRIRSDARYRFERGIDPAFTRDGLELATRLILDICGGEPSEVVTAGAVPDTARAYPLDPARVSSLVGMDIPPAQQVTTLEALGFAVEKADFGYSVTPPTWRPDVLGEADLVEEVARIASLSKLAAKPMRRGSEGTLGAALTPMQRRLRMVRRSLAAQGLNECVTYSFVGQRDAALFGGGGEAMALENPISSDLSHMRPSALPHLIAAAARNQARGFDTVALFEVGPGFHGGEPGEQSELAVALRAGFTAPRDWAGSRRAVDLWDARADAEAVLAACGVAADKVQIARDVPDWLHPGRAAALKLGPKTTLALFGELHPRVLAAMDLKGPAVACLVHLAEVPFPKARSATRPALGMADLQPVERDFAFVVDARVEAATLLKAARGADRKAIVDASVFDVFDGPRAAAALGEGRKSVALTVRLQPESRSFTDDEIAAIGARIVSAVTQATGGTLRA